VKIETREYQASDVDYAMGHGVNDRVIHCAPTGSGKTIIQCLIAKREMDRGNSTAILTPRNEIFTQTHGAAASICGANNVSTMRAKRQGEYWNPMNPVHVISWPTLIARVRKDKDFWFPRVDRVLVDECHLSMAPKILEILNHYELKARVDGYTATPARQTGRGLGYYFTEIKNVVSVRQLIKEGYLAPVEYYGADAPDLTGIKIRKGDYEVGKLSKACVELVGDAIDNWLRLASDRHTITFAVDIRHCEALADRFNRVGIKAEALHTGLSQGDRDRVVAAFKAQKIQVLVNVGIASYGFDAPSVRCVQVCRPTKSIVLHLQMIGRGMRPKPDGGECMVLDHAGNVPRLGMADDLFRWRLDDGKKACDNWSRHPKSGEAEESKQYECQECRHIFSRQRICPKCGWQVPFSKRDIEAKDADLVPIGRNTAKPLPPDWPSYEVFYAMLRHYAQEKGRKPMWAVFTFEKKAKCRPPHEWNNHALVPPSPRVLNYIRSREIAFYKAKQRA